MNKQEVIEKLHEAGLNSDQMKYAEKYDKGYKNGIAYALNLVSKLDEPEKPVVPQFVADMIIKRKTAGQSVIKAIENLRFYEDACKWVRNNGETFVKAWLFGYEVEKEKLYTVELPNPYEYDNAHITLSKKSGDKIYIDYHFNDCWQTYEKSQLTEAEIKKDFDWAWQFAEEVEE
ncbi:DUF1642 domain-containing protein [Streptococcus equinus]|uniref:DUF1642 domain-containing protein n=1 Tax=Streptococcus equinus TaxID=1335 RepID=A0A1G9KGC3_STREI|nr:DUF1642 domain-containing protein [Streptococcus equinus]QBX15834.1 hypothetical protein Javan215_0031 [Streptococcus phage Javan215]SDL48574.1 Protein of unknown function [Streptococcus equinus]